MMVVVLPVPAPANTRVLWPAPAIALICSSLNSCFSILPMMARAWSICSFGSSGCGTSFAGRCDCRCRTMGDCAERDDGVCRSALRGCAAAYRCGVRAFDGSVVRVDFGDCRRARCADCTGRTDCDCRCCPGCCWCCVGCEAGSAVAVGRAVVAGRVASSEPSMFFSILSSPMALPSITHGQL